MKTLLSIDGGGIRGIVPATILAHLEALLGSPLRDRFDLIAGTSTGGILGLALTHPTGYTAGQCIDFYTEDGPTIFSRSWSHLIGSGAALWGPKYPATGIESVLKKTFGMAMPLYAALSKVMVLTFDYAAYETLVLKSWQHDATFFDAARGTSAAPTYFAPHACSLGLLADGGLFANDPALCGLVELHTLFPDETDFLVVSLGCGTKSSNVGPSNAGLIGSGAEVVEVLFDAQPLATDYLLGELLPKGRYVRLNPAVPAVAMDDASSDTLYLLSAIAKGWIAANGDRLAALASLLKGAKSCKPAA
jgi:hypothetical protein